jgi:molybdopterin/thiamine biosynthesis adenylyltransferase
MDYSRQLVLLDPDNIGKKSVSIIGVGATGSYVAMQLAQMGWGNSPMNQGLLKVWDGDIVEEHNLCNQAYDRSHIGMPKVMALADLVMRKCGFEIETHNEMVTTQQEVRSTYVFILTDTMASRKEIFEKCLQYSFNTDLVIETRMSIDKGRVYAFDPNNPVEVDEWQKTLYTDDQAEVSACGASASIVPTVYNLASRAVWRLIHHFDNKYGKEYLKGDAAVAPRVLSELQFSFPEFVASDGEHYDHMYRQFKSM